METNIHPMSQASPNLSDPAMRELRDSIAKIGQRVPIVLWRGQIIDGRKRLAACQALGLEPSTVTLSDDADGAEHARALNLLRTHYTQSQRAMFASALANATRSDGGRKSNRAKNREPGVTMNKHVYGGAEEIITQEQAAHVTGASIEAIRQAKRVRKTASPPVIAAVERGELSLYAAGRIAALPDTEQGPAVERALKAKGKFRRLPPGTVSPRAQTMTRHRPAAEVFGRFMDSLEHSAKAFDLFGPKEIPTDEPRLNQWRKQIQEIVKIVSRLRRQLRNGG